MTMHPPFEGMKLCTVLPWRVVELLDHPFEISQRIQVFRVMTVHFIKQVLPFRLNLEWVLGHLVK